MTLLRSRIFTFVVVFSVLGAATLAHAQKTGSVAVHHAWSRETAAGQSVGGGFMIIANRAAASDRLLSGTSPIATEVQLHTMTMDRGVMRMRQVQGGIAVPANGTLELRPGSYHIMFMGLKRQLRRGERFPVTLRFQRAGNVTIQFAVQPVSATGPMEGGHGGH